MYENLFKALNGNNIRYLVTGGVAVLLRGFLRATADLDLMVSFSRDNITAFTTVLEKLGYQPGVPVSLDELASAASREKWKKEKGMIVFPLYNPKKPQDMIDVLVYEPIPFDEAYSRRELIYAGDTPISVVSVVDLIRLKKISGRPQDLEDIRALNDIGDNNER